MRTLFISDIHLSDQRPDLTRALLYFLDEISDDCEQLYLLGDIFDAWIGDDFIHPELIAVIERLATLSQNGTHVFFQHGNRDFLVGQHFADRIHATLLPEEKTVTLPNGQQALIMHGDQLCIDDAEYQQFRSLVRNPAWQADFLSKPLQERLDIAQNLRAASKEKTSGKAQEIMDVNPDSVRSALQNANCTLIIHGHTHRPAVHHQQIDKDSGCRIVLGDWDTDFWYLSCTPDGCELLHQQIETN